MTRNSPQPSGSDPGGNQPGEGLRIDKWLWQARFCKSRSIAGRLCAEGRVRAGGAPIRKAHHRVRPGDVLAFPQGRQIRVVRILELGSRRGPASEARLLYEDLAPRTAAEPEAGAAGAAAGRRDPGSGRPTKAERRAIERLKREE